MWLGHSVNETGGTGEILSGRFELVEQVGPGGIWPSGGLATVRPIRLSLSGRPASSWVQATSSGSLKAPILHAATGGSNRLDSSGSRTAKEARQRRPPRAQVAMFGAGVGVRCLPHARLVAAAVVPATQAIRPQGRQPWRRTAIPLDSLPASPDRAERRPRRFLSNRTPGTVFPWPTAGGTALPTPDARAARISRRRNPRQRASAQAQ